MGTNLTSVFSRNTNRTSLPLALKKAAAVAIVSYLLSGSLVAAAASYSGAAASQQTGNVSVNRTNKGDRLPGRVTLKNTPGLSSPAVSAAPRPPIGCDPAFSRTAEPVRAHIFGRSIT
jgi:hypothetical protein